VSEQPIAAQPNDTKTPSLAPHFADATRAWTAREIEAAAFDAPLERAVADELRAARAGLAVSREALPLDRARLPALAAAARAVASRFLEAGPGAARIPRHSFGDLSDVEQANAAWALLTALGEPMPQNDAGELWVAVRDEGQRMAAGGRYHKSNEGGELHSDGPQYEAPPRFVGLLCLRTARDGGVSKVVSGHALHNALRSEASDLLPTLYQSFEFHKKPTPETTRAPILSWNADGARLRVRYLGEYVRSGHQVAKRPLRDGERAALDALDALLADEARFVVELRLEPGDLLLVDNDRILHGRSAFRDAPERPGREMARIWIAAAAGAR
jgi:alpha-ketoglutarate-dependent taurine dioxygenase